MTARTRRLLLVVGGALTLALLTPGLAGARWTRISARRSRDQPFYACAKRHARARCALIRDPTRGDSRRGPVQAGAITAGPEEQASPAMLGNGAEGGYSPENLRSAYDLPSTTGGSGQTVAIVDAYDDPNAESDLNVYRSFYALPECTKANGCFKTVNEHGGTSMPAANAEWAEEISLDLDMVSAICPHCHILLVAASGEEPAELSNAENEAAKLGATEISNSYGFEFSSEPTHASAFDHPGIPITVAAGDSGYKAEWPAANPNVIAVGGTSLEPASNSRHWKESVWYGKEAGETYGTGSGCSKEPKPAWQKDAGCSFRTNNDVAAVADQNTPVSSYDSYQNPSPWQLMGGTSVATPIIAAAMALANPYTRTFEGAKALYAQAALSTGTLDDVTVGKNGTCGGSYLCEAKVGYDGPTGLGSLWEAPEVPPPAFATEAATAVTNTGATLGATVEPNDAEIECSFEYGTTSAMGSSLPCSKAHLTGVTKVTVSASLSNLAPATLYHFRVAGAYTGGPGAGSELTFSTSASPPGVATEPATQITNGSATLNASINPEGQSTTCVFEYEPATAHGSSVPCAHSAGAGTGAVSVSASLTGLAPNTTYRFKVVATNSTGTTKGSQREFKTLPSTITNLSSASLTASSASVSAVVDPNGVQVISCNFEYGTTSSFGSSKPCAPPPGEGESAVTVSAQLQELSANTTYHFRVAVTTKSGAGHSTEATFSTLPDPPLATTGEPSSIGDSRATANATVEPGGAELSACLFQYGEVEAGGTTASVPCSALPSAGEGPQAVSAPLTGLAAGTTYEYRIVAGNAGGISYSEFRRFTTSPVISVLPTEENNGEGTGPPPPPAAPTATLASTRLTVSRAGIIAIQVRCAPGAGSCTGTLTLRTLDAVAALNAHGPKRIATLAQGSFAVSAGREVTVRLHIDPTGRRLLLRARLLRARATITASHPDPATNRQAIVTLRALTPATGRH